MCLSGLRVGVCSVLAVQCSVCLFEMYRGALDTFMKRETELCWSRFGNLRMDCAFVRMCARILRKGNSECKDSFRLLARLWSQSLAAHPEYLPTQIFFTLTELTFLISVLLVFPFKHDFCVSVLCFQLTFFKFLFFFISLLHSRYAKRSVLCFFKNSCRTFSDDEA